MRLIDADRLLEPGHIGKYYHLPNGDIAIPIIDIEHAPTVDAVPVVRCKDCKHRPTEIGANSLEFPDCRCPCQCEDDYYSWMPKDNWFCANGERKES